MTELSSFAIAPGSRGASVQLALSRREILARYRPADGESQRQAANTSAANSPIPGETASQFGTPQFVPLWNAPQLLPTFVAQILGQAISPPVAAAPRGYRPSGARQGILIDLQR